MTYASLNKIEIKVVSKGLPKVIKNCPKCGGGSHFINTGKFRVNANKKYLDIWLIFKCEKCKSTWNMTLYERLNSKDMDGKYLKRLMNNDNDLAMFYGYNRECIRKNGVKIDYSGLVYKLKGPDVDIILKEGNRVCIRFWAEEELACKLIHLLSDLLQISATKVRKLFADGYIQYHNPKKFHKEKLGKDIEVILASKIWERIYDS